MRPYSYRFQSDLGYEIFRFEPTFQLSTSSEVNPDLVISSSDLGDTLVLEWSAADTLGRSKEDQLRRYSEVRTIDLISVLAVPMDSAKTHDIVLILKDVAATAFAEFLAKKGWQFPILTLEQHDSKYLLEKARHAFQAQATDDFFGEGLEFERIPLRYLPFSLEEINHAAIVTPVIQHLTSLMVRDVEEVSMVDFCSGYVPAWGYISLEKQREIRNNTRQILAEVARDRVGQELIKRNSENTTSWLLPQNDEFRRRTKFFTNFLDRFAARKRGDSDQLEIPFENESEDQ